MFAEYFVRKITLKSGFRGIINHELNVLKSGIGEQSQTISQRGEKKQCKKRATSKSNAIRYKSVEIVHSALASKPRLRPRYVESTLIRSLFDESSLAWRRVALCCVYHASKLLCYQSSSNRAALLIKRKKKRISDDGTTRPNGKFSASFFFLRAIILFV